MRRSLRAFMLLTVAVTLSACAESGEEAQMPLRTVETISREPRPANGEVSASTSVKPEGTTSSENAPTTKAATKTSAVNDDVAPSTSAAPAPAQRAGGYYTASNNVAASHPQCDGRWILIYESVHGFGVDTPAQITRALNSYPSSEYTNPGECPSLRARVDGQDIYPVYRDFGSDVEGMCAAWRSGGQTANPRSLNMAGDFSHPC
ncbi:hypothetical protein G7Y29_09155 [Corynebacterium qintianiae]|uniref:Uncharacterized protein n=1 Tax=Corynebacterium qintianiae TaxID=2709392 RepID=A0A7T0KND1_9CORY|nr:hypothetical protein [Corynebacterium qintianiae]QPK82998.1 hypothetical protein G7Y29_09155 [Corynebacterium qintianiae]